MRLRAHYRCDAAGCTRTRRLIFIAATARLGGDYRVGVDYSYDDVGLHLCHEHVRLHVNGLHVALRSDKPNPHGLIALISRGTPRIGVVDATSGREIYADDDA